MSELRKSFSVAAVLELPSSRWDGPAAIIHPFRVTAASAMRENVIASDSGVQAASLRHPICRALDWQKRLEAENGLNKAQIARDEKVTRTLVTQLFHLLDLDETIQKYLASLCSESAIQYFSVRQLLKLAKLEPEEQLTIFEEMKDSCERRST